MMDIINDSRTGKRKRSEGRYANDTDYQGQHHPEWYCSLCHGLYSEDI